ncbi:hypothetical protein ACM66B_002890 [Microbotryomycetes sp. NB124-2]
MGRRKPISGKARKEHLKLKRAIKRDQDGNGGDGGPGTSSIGNGSLTATSSSRPLGGQHGRRPAAKRYMTTEERHRADKVAGRVKLESRFIRLPPQVQERHRLMAATERLERPVRAQLGVLKESDLLWQPNTGDADDDDDELKPMTCPKRPKWRYTMTKLEVERNEEGMFEQWLSQTDARLARFAQEQKAQGSSSPVSPTYFERNLNVWRQLWRTTEISDILLILVDVRFPLLHYPPSLEAYVKSLRDKRVILVLTKTDLVPRWVADAWRAYFERREGPDGAEVVEMESYRETARREETQGTKPKFEPGAPVEARFELVDALRRAHQKLLTPPRAVSDFPDRLARWKPRVKQDVDWESVEDEAASKAREAEQRSAKDRRGRRRKDRDAALVPRQHPMDGGESEHEGERGDDDDEQDEPLSDEDPYPYISIGLIGQPNVGKSSLLNALLGRKVVRASRTPGKTKSLQTIYWNQTVRLVDCPGLVCPSFAGMERQVLAGILPIQNIEAVLHFVAQRLPLERVLGLETSEPLDDDEDDLAREISGKQMHKGDDEDAWTTDRILVEYALQQDFVTAKAGRPDVYRAGAQILRHLHSSAIPWTFRPPSDLDKSVAGDQRIELTEGIWLKDFVPRADAQVARSVVGTTEGEEDDDEDDDDGVTSEEEEEEDSEAGADQAAVAAVKSAFSALEVEEADESDDTEGEGYDAEEDDAELSE